MLSAKVMAGISVRSILMILLIICLSTFSPTSAQGEIPPECPRCRCCGPPIPTPRPIVPPFAVPPIPWRTPPRLGPPFPWRGPPAPFFPRRRPPPPRFPGMSPPPNCCRCCVPSEFVSSQKSAP